MNEPRAIVPTADTWRTITEIAPIAAASRLYNVDKGQAAMIMLTGHELGLGLTAAFEFIHVIQGKPSISPKGTLALIQRSGELAGLDIKDEVDAQGKPSACTVTMKRRNGTSYTARYTMQDAQTAGLVKPGGNWTKYPANMLRWRAVGYCADVVFPDVIGGMYRPEELGADVNADGVPTISTYEEPGDYDPATLAMDELTGGEDNEALDHAMSEPTPEYDEAEWRVMEDDAPPGDARTWPELRDAVLQEIPYYNHAKHVSNTLGQIYKDRIDAGARLWDSKGVLLVPWSELFQALLDYAMTEVDV